MAKAKKKKPTKQQVMVKRLFLTIAILIPIILIAILVFTSLTSNPIEQNRQSAKISMEKTVNELMLPGELLNQNTTDNECKKTTIGLATRFDCRIIAQKIYKAPRESISEQQLVEAISNLQWSHVRGNSYSKQIDNFTVTMVLHYDSAERVTQALNDQSISISNDEVAYVSEFTIIYYSD